MKVRIVQCLCPHRHCILAIAYEADTGEADPERTELLRRSVNEAINTKQMNPHCGICLATTDRWEYEDNATVWPSLEAAAPTLRNTEALNIFAMMAALKRQQAARN